MTLTHAITDDLASLSDADLDLVERQAKTIARDAAGVAEILDGLAKAVAIERQRRAGQRQAEDRETAIPETLEQLDAAPEAVIVDQREAMLRAWELREDTSLSVQVRAIWGGIVDRLADLRREAKAEVGRQRLDGSAASEDEYELERMAQETARRLDHDRGAQAEQGGTGATETAAEPEAGPLPGPRPEASTESDLGPSRGLAGGTGSLGTANLPAVGPLLKSDADSRKPGRG